MIDFMGIVPSLSLNSLESAIMYGPLNFPIILWCLIGIALFLTVSFGFINFTQVPKAIKLMVQSITPDKSTNPELACSKEKGKKVSSITAFLSQAASNLGIGNMSGAAFAMFFAGPGVILWMLFFGSFFAIIKFCEITLGHKYKTIADGSVSGGFFYVLRNGLGSKNSKVLKKLGRVFGSISAAIILICVSFWSAFQMNQISVACLSENTFFKAAASSALGLADVNLTAVAFVVLIILIVATILFGGIQRLGAVANAIVPFMALIYFGICMVVMFKHSENIAPSLKTIFVSAFNGKSAAAGLAVVIITAMQRIVFATEAGAGTAAIMHATSNVKYSARQGYTAFADGVLISFILSVTAFTILVSGVDFTSGTTMGVALLHEMFIQNGSILTYILTTCIFLFGFTSITANGYYIQKASGYLFGVRYKKLYIVLYVLFVLFANFYQSVAIIKIIDILMMINFIPNLIGLLILWPDVKQELKVYLDSEKQASQPSQTNELS